MNYENEEWRLIVDYPKYEVSNYGRVASLDYKRLGKRVILNQYIGKNGYAYVSLSGKLHTVHRLVAKAFIPNPNNYPIINHKDENRTNNIVDNLEWCTYSYNAMYNDSHKKRAAKYSGVNCKLYGVPRPQYVRDKVSKAKKGVPKSDIERQHFRESHTRDFRIHQIDKNGAVVGIFLSSKHAKEITGVCDVGIRACCRGKLKTAGGYIWKRVKIQPNAD